MGTTTVSGAKKTGGSTTTSSTSTDGTVGATTITSSTAGSHQHYIANISNLPHTAPSITTTTYIIKNLQSNQGDSAYRLAGSSVVPTLGRTSTGISGSGSHTHTITPPYYILIYCVKLP